MANLKNPVFSLEARKTLGNTLTFTQRRGQKIAEKKPIPADRRTLSQAYQRWLYQDYVYLWSLLSNVLRRQYAAQGVRFHLTAFQYWMKYELTNLPDIAAWYKMDDNRGVATVDSSRNTNPAVVTGALPAVGLIDGAFLFDGVNDLLAAPHISATTFSASDSFTIAVTMRGDSTAFGTLNVFLNKRITKGYTLQARATTSLYQVYVGTQNIIGSTNLMDDAWHKVLLIKDIDAGTLAIYVDDALDAAPAAYTGGDCADLGPLRIGTHLPATWPYKGLIDNVIVSNTAWDETRRRLYQERSYPSL